MKTKITIEEARKVFRGKKLFLFPKCGRLELGLLFDIAEKKLRQDTRAITPYNMLIEDSGISEEKINAVVKSLQKHTVLKDNLVYDKLSNGKLLRRYE